MLQSSKSRCVRRVSSEDDKLESCIRWEEILDVERTRVGCSDNHLGRYAHPDDKLGGHILVYTIDDARLAITHTDSRREC